MKKRMKRLAALALAACMFASITACGSKLEDTASVSVEIKSESVVIEEETEAEKTPVPAEQTEAEVAAEQEAEAAEQAEASAEQEAEAAAEQGDTPMENQFRKMLQNYFEDGIPRTEETLKKILVFMDTPINSATPNISNEDVTLNRIAEALVYNQISKERVKKIFREEAGLKAD